MIRNVGMVETNKLLQGSEEVLGYEKFKRDYVSCQKNGKTCVAHAVKTIWDEFKNRTETQMPDLKVSKINDILRFNSDYGTAYYDMHKRLNTYAKNNRINVKALIGYGTQENFNKIKGLLAELEKKKNSLPMVVVGEKFFESTSRPYNIPEYRTSKHALVLYRINTKDEGIYFIDPYTRSNNLVITEDGYLDESSMNNSFSTRDFLSDFWDLLPEGDLEVGSLEVEYSFFYFYIKKYKWKLKKEKERQKRL